MRVYIIIPTYNEEAFLAKTLQSLLEQSLLPSKIVVVNDNSTDNTQEIIDSYSKKSPVITSVNHSSENKHIPGSKVIRAVNFGLEQLDNNYDIICKFDADLIFPTNYLQLIVKNFNKDTKIGMAGGYCYIEKNNKWIIENLTNKNHIRGALKAYRKDCFQQIGGLKPNMGWDTIDELLAQYHGWSIKTDSSLHVKHLKPTGNSYSKSSRYKQGEAFYTMRYGFLLSFIATVKLAFYKKSLTFFINTIFGFFNASKKKLPFIVNEKEGMYIRQLRWKGIKQKIF